MRSNRLRESLEADIFMLKSRASPTSHEARSGFEHENVVYLCCIGMVTSRLTWAGNRPHTTGVTPILFRVYASGRGDLPSGGFTT